MKPAMELRDLYDENRTPLFRARRRGEPLEKGEYYLVAEVWTVNGKNQFLLTLRDGKKEEYPGKWENTQGSARAGEGSREAAIRELFEETGIAARPEELFFLGTYRGARSFHDLYLLRRDVFPTEIRLQPGETAAAKWVSLSELEALMEQGDVALPVAKKFAAVRAALLKRLKETEEKK